MPGNPTHLVHPAHMPGAPHSCMPYFSHAICLHAWYPNTTCASRPRAGWSPASFAQHAQAHQELAAKERQLAAYRARTAELHMKLALQQKAASSDTAAARTEDEAQRETQVGRRP